MEWNYTTQLEGQDVIVFWWLEADEAGIYDSEVKMVLYKGIDVLPILSEETIYELDGRSMNEYEANLMEKWA